MCKWFLVQNLGEGRPRSIQVDNIEMHFQAHTDHSHGSKRTKWKKIITEQRNGLPVAVGYMQKTTTVMASDCRC
jgi:hypothetical protein